MTFDEFREETQRYNEYNRNHPEVRRRLIYYECTWDAKKKTHPHLVQTLKSLFFRDWSHGNIFLEDERRFLQGPKTLYNLTKGSLTTSSVPFSFWRISDWTPRNYTSQFCRCRHVFCFGSVQGITSRQSFCANPSFTFERWSYRLQSMSHVF